MVHVDNEGIIDGFGEEERKCIDPKAGDADLWIKIWEELHHLNVAGNTGGSRACQSAQHRKGQAIDVAF